MTAAVVVSGAMGLWAGRASASDRDGVPELALLKDYAAYRASSTNPDPASNDDSLRPIPGETVVLADLEGPGVVDHIWLTVAASEYGWPRLLRFRVYYDGSPVPSVDAPVGDFFGVGHGLERPLSSLIVRASSSGRSRNCYWPMPFKESCRITVTNEGTRRVSNLYYHVDWRRVPFLPKDTAYFHARYHQELPVVSGRPYPVLETDGRGHLVGAVLSVIQSETGWFGEGDESIFVDGANQASIIGTGTEDYFNDAWSLRVDSGPYAGVTVAEGTGLGSRMTAYRWHLVDPVPYTSSLRFVFEHNGWTFNDDGSVESASGERSDLFSSVAFWYSDGIDTGQPPVPFGPARLPHGNATQIEVEDLVGSIIVTGGAIEVLPELFWGKDVLLFSGEAPGSSFDIPFRIAAQGRYELSVQCAHSFDYGTYTTLLDGEPTVAAATEHEPGATVLGNEINAYHHETYVGADHLVGWFDLAPGDHVLTFVCTGRDGASSGFGIGIDSLVLARTGPAAWPGEGDIDPHARTIRSLAIAPPDVLRAQMQLVAEGLGSVNPAVRRAALEVVVQRDMVGELPLAVISTALRDGDPVVRGLAAIALRDLGTAALGALDPLIAALADTDENVRIMAADALAAIGPAAAPAVPALIASCSIEDEEVHALRSMASALGAIGPPALKAIPILERLAEIPRVSWPALAAIAQIEGD